MLTNKQLAIAAGSVFITGYIVGSTPENQGSEPKMTDYVNPTSEHNFIYQTVNAVLAILLDSKEADLGIWIYDLVHGKPNVNIEIITGNKFEAYPPNFPELSQFFTSAKDIPAYWEIKKL